jgi:hypothetical protein
MKVVTKYIPEIPNQVMAKDEKGNPYWFSPGGMVDTEEKAREIERLAGRDIIYNRVSARAVEITKAIEHILSLATGESVDTLIDTMIASIQRSA